MTEHSLEIYKIILNRDVTFHTLVNKKWKRDDENDLDESAAFERLYTKFIEGLVGNGVWESTNHKKKGLAVMSVDPNINSLNEILVIHGNDRIIEGYIDGGRYDVKRKMATYTDVQQKEEIPKDKIITDSFYVYMYIRMNSNKGILMVESKKGISMSGVFTEYVSKKFKQRGVCTCSTQMFMPNELRTRFMEDSVLSSVTCSDSLVSSVKRNGVDEEEQFKITIKVEPINKPMLNNRKDIVESILNIGVKMGNSLKQLSNFSRQRGEMRNDVQNSSKSFELSDPDVVPKYPLPDDMFDDNNSILYRNRVKAKCDELLQSVQRETYLIVPPIQQEQNDEI